LKLQDILKDKNIAPAVVSASKIISKPTRKYVWDAPEALAEIEKPEINTEITNKENRENNRKTPDKTTESQVQPSRISNLKLEEGHKTEKEIIYNENFLLKPEIYNLSGEQRKAFIWLVNNAKEFGQSLENGDRVTPPINGKIMANEVLNKPYLSSKNVIYNLCSKNYIKLIKAKHGRGGYTIYSIANNLYQECLLQQNFFNKDLSLINSTNSNLNEEVNSIKRTDQRSMISLEFNELPFTIPAELKGMVAIKQLMEFLNSKAIGLEELQSSLDGFSYDLSLGKVKSITGNPISILIGALKKGGYISSEYITKLRNELEEIDARHLEVKKMNTERNLLILQRDFEVFQNKHPERVEKIKESLSSFSNFEEGSIGYRALLEEYKNICKNKNEEELNTIN